MSSSISTIPEIGQFLQTLAKQTTLSEIEYKMIRQECLHFFSRHKKFFLQLKALSVAGLIANDVRLLIRRRYRHILHFDSMRAYGLDRERVASLEAKSLAILFDSLTGLEPIDDNIRSSRRTISVIPAGQANSKHRGSDFAFLLRLG